MPLDQKELSVAGQERKDALPGATTESGLEFEPAPEPAPSEFGWKERGGRLKEQGELIAGGEAPAAPTATPANAEALKTYKQIEGILEEDLGEIYNNLSPKDQQVFKIKGEEAARSIFKVVYHQAKIKVKKIIHLIKKWLRTVPGINRYFLEQEAKIKADKIVALARNDKKIEF
ncbi:MAG: hypothetical protein WC668_02560 [Patescibacteria group bacterium]|jgi:hypothetical protein